MAPDQPPPDSVEQSGFRPRRSTLVDLQPGMTIGPKDTPFRLVKEIGGGAMGRVWVARDLEEERVEGGEHRKALKVITPLLQDAPRALDQLKREAARASRLAHPHIVNVYGHRQGRDGWLFVVMDYLEGRNLDQLLLDEGNPGLSWERTRQLLVPIAEALDHAHGRGILHCDLKPGNVLVTDEGEVQLLDFGLAYRLRRSRSAVNVSQEGVGGTPEYMPPEAFTAGEPTKARDVYALACLAYEMLTGEPPYEREAAARRPPELLPPNPESLTDAAWEVLKSGLAHRPADRPDQAGEWVRRLTEAQAASQEEVYHPEPSPLGAKRFWGVMAVGILAAVVWIVSSVVPNWPEEWESPSAPGASSHSKRAQSELPPVQAIHGWPTEKVKALQQQTAAALGKEVVFRDRLRGGSPGPAMVVIPAGKFRMGSPRDEAGRYDDERRHEVEIEVPFAISKHEVTFAEYDRFVRATGWTLPDDEGWGRGERPVINVTWEDAVAYTKWLSAQTGQDYRLPTEAEWEYTARAGTATRFWWGDEASHAYANYWGMGGADRWDRSPAPTGSFSPNPFGLYEVLGNVWEWICSA